MLATVNDRLMLKFAISEGTSQRYVENVVWFWLDLRERLKRSDTDPLTLTEFTSRSKDWQALRKNNGYFVGSQFKAGIRHKLNAHPRQLLTYDIDKGSAGLLKLLRDGTSGIGPCEYVVYSTRTHGNGAIKLRLVIPLPQLLPKDKFEPLSRILAEAIDPDMIVVDPVSFKPSQYMYWPSHCADIEPIYIHHTGPLLDADRVLKNWSDAWGDWSNFAILPHSPREQARLRPNVLRSADPLTKRGHVGTFCRRWDIHEAIIAFNLPYVPGEMGPDGIPARYSYTQGTSSNGMVVYDDGHKGHSHHSSDPLSDLNFNSWDMTMTHLYGHLNGTREVGEDPRKMPAYKAMVEMLSENEEFMALLRDSYYGLSPEDADDTFDVEPELKEVTSIEVVPVVEDATKWRDRLEMNEKGTIKPTANNVYLILRYAPPFRGTLGYDEFMHRTSFVKPLQSKSLGVHFPLSHDDALVPLEDHHVTTIQRMLDAPRGPKKTGWSLPVPYGTLDRVVNMVARANPVHPVRDYLDWLVPAEGVAILETLFVRACGTPDTPYYRMASRNVLMAAVARIYEPGCKFDFLTVLVGPEGIRKSTLVFTLGSVAWTTESRGHYDDKKKFVEDTLGFWFVEQGELTDFRRAADEESIKFNLSGGTDRVRLSYMYRPGYYPRQFIIFGTTNDREFLRSAHRRVWTIPCNRMIDTEWVEANRDQLFAEAVQAYRAMRREQPSGIPPLHLTGEADLEHRRLQDTHLLPNDTDAMTGIVREFFDEQVSKLRAKPGSNKTDVTFEGANDELVQRTVTCGLEIFVHALGNDRTKYDRRAALAISAIMRQLEPEWVVGPHARCGEWGIQRTYRRKSEPE